MERIVAAVVLAASVATAQHVTVAARAPTSLTAGVVYGGQPYNHVVPLGALPAQGHVVASSPYVPGSIQGASAYMHWHVQTPTVLLTPDVRITAGFTGSANSHITSQALRILAY